MDQKEIKKVFFVLITTLMMAAVFGSSKIGGLSLKQIPLLFVSAVIGITIYVNGKEHRTIEWVSAAIFGFVAFPLVYEKITLTLFTVLALLFALMIAMLPILIKIRERLFNN